MVNMAGDAFGLDPKEFDLDKWISGVQRPELVVALYPADTQIQAEIAEIEAQMELAEATSPENRGLNEASVEHLLMKVKDLRRRREESALRVRIKQLTETEMDEVRKAARAAGATDVPTVNLWMVSAACIEPKFTPEQLQRLRDRDLSGEHMVDQLVGALVELTSRGIPIPFSHALSDASRT